MNRNRILTIAAACAVAAIAARLRHRAAHRAARSDLDIIRDNLRLDATGTEPVIVHTRKAAEWAADTEEGQRRGVLYIPLDC